MDLSKHLTSQLQGMERLMSSGSAAILFRDHSLRGIPDPVLEGDAYTLEFIGSALLCLDIHDRSGIARLLADSLKKQTPVGV